MSAERFNVVLDGTILRGQPAATVALDLAKLIKRDNDFATALLQGQPTKIKSGIDAATGALYVGALERIGVAVHLEPESLEVDADFVLPYWGNDGTLAAQARSASAATSNIAPKEPPAAASQDDCYRAFIGPKNQAYYVDYFKRADAAGKMLWSWNWPALFFQFPWSLYRKLWGFAFGGLALAMLSSGAVGLFIGVVGYLVGADHGRSNAWLPLAWLAGFIVPGVFANGFYHRKAQRLIRKTEGISDANARLTELGLHGGVNGWILWVYGGIVTIVALGFAAIVMFASQSDTKRTNLGSAASQTGAATSATTAFDQSTARSVRPPDVDFVGTWDCHSNANDRWIRFTYFRDGRLVWASPDGGPINNAPIGWRLGYGDALVHSYSNRAEVEMAIESLTQTRHVVVSKDGVRLDCSRIR